MPMRGENLRFWAPVTLLAVLAAYSGQKLVRSHVDPEVSAPKYVFERSLPARRGSILASGGRFAPLVKSVPHWEYRLDPVALTNAVVRRRGEPQRPKAAIVKTIADALGLKYSKVKEMASAAPTRGWRSQFLALSSDPDAHRTLADSTLVAGVAIHDKQVRQYLHGRSMAHILGSVNSEGVGSSGLELRFDRELTGTSGVVRGMKDARGRELYDKRLISIDPKPGADIYLTVEPNVQFETEQALSWGMAEFGAGSGWAIVMDAASGAIYAMASYPDFNPLSFGSTSDSAKMNRAVAFNYEPGSVMKVLTVATAMEHDPKRFGPDTVYRTNRDDPGYYKLPGDGSHVWEPTMTLKDAIVHSSNIVIGKLAYDIGPLVLHDGLRRFGLGAKTGVELPGEQYGILPDPRKRQWDLASRSRAGIGQFVAVTAIQLASAYQAIANDGVRMQPHIVSRIVGPGGEELFSHVPQEAGRPISSATARSLRDMMVGVASPQGTARRAAIRGYSVAGKTGTAQKQIPGGKGYSAGLYRATFCGIVPAAAPRIVVLVTLDFDKKTLYHQGGNSAGPVFKRIALASIRYLGIAPDRPEELDEFDSEDEFDRIVDERAAKYGIIQD